MKKNRMMRLASLLLVLVLMTSSVVGGTFAKYVTSGVAEDTARVAKFGVTVEGSTDLFHDAYQNAFKAYISGETLDNITVQADTEGTDLVAPGTEGTLSKFDISGTPEVDTMVDYAVDFELSDNWTVEGAEYCPIVITVVKDGVSATYGMTGTSADNEYATIALFETGVEEAIKACAKRYHTNQDLSDAEDDVVISWSWPFSTGDVNDVKDTALGDAAADGNAATIYLKVTCSVTQID